MLGEQTLFKNIRRVPAATLVTVNTQAEHYRQQLYWQWSEIKPLNDISFDEAVEKSLSAFDASMARCMSVVKQPKLAITLSGGLDSEFCSLEPSNTIKAKSKHLPLVNIVAMMQLLQNKWLI